MFKNYLWLVIFVCNIAFAQSGTYEIDPEHSFANWKIRHVVSKTSGTIPNMSGKMEINIEDMRRSTINVTMSLLDIDSDHKKRDSHIQEEKFLNTEKFSSIQFISSGIQMKDERSGIVSGVLTMGGKEKQIDIPFTILGFGDDPWGGYRIGLEGNVDIKASDFGYSWGLKENGPLGDKIEINLLVEGKKK